MDLDDYTQDYNDLAGLWSQLQSPILYWLDENGVNMGNACLRHFYGETWLYCDDSDGFTLMLTPEINADALCEEGDERLNWGYAPNGELIKR